MAAMNQFMSEIPEPIWWGFQQQQQYPIISHPGQSTRFGFDLNGESSRVHVDKEPMFEKPLTPSDVGKLNRLVIPKQHAEKYFPLSGFSGDVTPPATAAVGEKGLLLSLEDELGKFWRFRYSYWNSSQSYVLTRGWSRFVKEKRLDAGDIVVFERGGDRLFIGWRRRGLAPQTGGSAEIAVAGNDIGGFYPAHTSSYRAHLLMPSSSDSSLLHAGTSDDHDHVHQQLTPTTSFVGSSQKRSVLRLFGVNMECQLEDHNRY